MSELIGYRVASWDTPLRANAHRTEARYNRVDSPATQYLALHPLTPWAEYCRTQGLRDPDEVATRRLTTWVVRLPAEPVTEIGFDDAGDWGLAPEDLVADEYTACQDLAERLRADPDAPKVIRVPSAALPGTHNLVTFGERVMIPYCWPPIDDGDIPACVVAEAARPPDDLFRLIRHRGQEHAGLEAWSAGREYEFADLQTAS